MNICALSSNSRFLFSLDGADMCSKGGLERFHVLKECTSLVDDMSDSSSKAKNMFIPSFFPTVITVSSAAILLGVFTLKATHNTSAFLDQILLSLVFVWNNII